MKTARILYNSTEIHAAIKHLFSKPSPKDRRVAIVAYVGAESASYLPDPIGLRIVCSPSAGGTDPNALRHFMKKQASVEFSDGLHMKVYWSRKRGCVIASANASSSALGINGLKEAGVLFAAGHVDIDRLLKYAKPRKATAADLRKLDQLAKDRERKNPRERRSRESPFDFVEWYSLPHRPQWKFNWADEEVSGAAPAAKEQALSMYGLREPHTWSCVAKGRVQASEWLLCFFIGKRGISQLEWKYVDFIVKTKRTDKQHSRAYPFHAVQVHPPSKYPTPPFKISPEFRKALGRALKKYGLKRLEAARSDQMPVKVLKEIASELGAGHARRQKLDQTATSPTSR